MKLTLVLVGKTTNPNLQALIDDYQGRLVHYIPFSVQVIPELRNARSLSEAEQKEAEGKLILQQVENGDRVVLLDERGKQFRSVELAQRMQQLLFDGRDVKVVVGGPYGFSDKVYGRADEMWSLSKMTFSHQMIRLLFVEQAYRAMTILKGEKYHHE